MGQGPETTDVLFGVPLKAPARRSIILSSYIGANRSNLFRPRPDCLVPFQEDTLTEEKGAAAMWPNTGIVYAYGSGGEVSGRGSGESGVGGGLLKGTRGLAAPTSFQIQIVVRSMFVVDRRSSSRVLALNLSGARGLRPWALPLFLSCARFVSFS